MVVGEEHREVFLALVGFFGGELSEVFVRVVGFVGFFE